MCEIFVLIERTPVGIYIITSGSKSECAKYWEEKEEGEEIIKLTSLVHELAVNK
jgi:hypothetical protein